MRPVVLSTYNSAGTIVSVDSYNYSNKYLLSGEIETNFVTIPFNILNSFYSQKNLGIFETEGFKKTVIY